MDIEHEYQIKDGNSRMCGAACLSMIYGGYGISRDQTDCWKDVKSDDGNGCQFSKNHMLCLDLLSNNLNAIMIRVRDVKSVIEKCVKNNFGVILTHSLSKEFIEVGHATVLINCDTNFIEYHDPTYGPNCKRGYNNLASLMRPNSREVTGNVMIIIDNKKATNNKCPECDENIPNQIDCDVCGKKIDITLLSEISCTKLGCETNIISHIICPYCDRFELPLNN